MDRGVWVAASPVCGQGAELHYPSCLYRKPLGCVVNIEIFFKKNKKQKLGSWCHYRSFGIFSSLFNPSLLVLQQPHGPVEHGSVGLLQGEQELREQQYNASGMQNARGKERGGISSILPPRCF